MRTKFAENVTDPFDAWMDTSPADLPYMYRNIYFSDQAKLRLAHTVGVIQGISTRDAEFAKKMADSLHKYLLDMHAAPKIDYGPSVSVPSYRYLLEDDGTFGGFSFVIGVLVNGGRVREAIQEFPRENGVRMPDWRRELRRKNKWIEDLAYEFHNGGAQDWAEYRYTMNGGLLYHGPSIFNQEVFAVTQSNCLWSRHT